MSEPNESLATVEELFSEPTPRRYRLLTLPVKQKRVRIRSLTEKELTAYLRAVFTDKEKLREQRQEQATRRLLALCLVNAQGDRIVADDQLDKFAEWDSADTQFLYNEISPHVGLRQGDIEGLVKNSEATRVAG